MSPSSSRDGRLIVAVLLFILVVRSSPLLTTALPSLFLGPAFWAVRFLPSLFRGCQRRASFCGLPCHLAAVVVLFSGDVALRFGGPELSTVGNYFPRRCGAGLGEPSFLPGGASFATIVS